MFLLIIHSYVTETFAQLFLHSCFSSLHFLVQNGDHHCKVSRYLILFGGSFLPLPSPLTYRLIYRWVILLILVPSSKLTALEAHFVPFESSGDSLFSRVDWFAAFRALGVICWFERHCARLTYPETKYLLLSLESTKLLVQCGATCTTTVYAEVRMRWTHIFLLTSTHSTIMWHHICAPCYKTSHRYQLF